ncbi:UvrD-helicase domain-containing protein [Bifidobacterium sp. ESL0690]|uniref:UvrD-helicase domain-containing protein n=1 Tax=Bifidobacterium sp. ESL0690 TaxID=2983214 RepID=UPI0023F9B9E2|nr:UvrD-helicase domain-containing protein [Bifidobacterium sp. ESL0690]WEV47439.1 UvrD-helicase domain-containing protein [Bifidobacterium sp. ESL0690]
MENCNNVVRISVAGSGKTQWVIDQLCRPEIASGKTVAISFTRHAQHELSERLIQERTKGAIPRVIGWYKFLLDEIVRPYFPLLYANRRVNNLHYVRGVRNLQWKTGINRYIDSNNDAYSDTLSLLANRLLQKSGGKAIKRLEQIYDHIYIDEFQDMRGNDLDIFEALFKSTIAISLVGDPRQSVISTSHSDTKKKKYHGSQIVNWLEEEKDNGLCTLDYDSKTYRYCQQIADFADLIFPAGAFEASISQTDYPESDMGIFFIDDEEKTQYCDQHGNVTFLRYDKKTDPIDHVETLNFGESKGITRDRILIQTTGPIRNLLLKEKELPETSACGFYVAVTRARYSVALVVPSPDSFMRKIKSTSRFAGFPFHVWHPSKTDSSVCKNKNQNS